VKGIQIPIPPLAEQQRIIAKVEDLMALCDQLELAQRERELRRDALRVVSLHRLTSPDPEADKTKDARFFLDTSSRLITKPEHPAAIRKAILDLAVQGQLVGHDPARWTLTTLGDIGTWGSGGTPTTGNPDYYGGSLPWVVIGDLNEGVVSHTAQTITELGLANSSAKLVEPGTVLIAMYGASVGKLGITGFRCATNQAIAHCVPKSSVFERDYLFLVLRSLRASLVASAKGGAQPNISQTVLKGWSITLPPPAEQRLIVAKVEELMALCDDLEAALTSAQHERGRLLEAVLHDALSGSDPA
jgi:type I restriction enzyme S subunit